jgi:hypothetical protein
MERDWMDEVDWDNEFKMWSLYGSEAERFFSWSSSFTYEAFKAFIFQLNVQVGESLLTLQRDFSTGNYDPQYLRNFLEWRVSANAVSKMERATCVNVVDMINEHPLEYKTDRYTSDCVKASTYFRGRLVFGYGACAECAISDCAKEIYTDLFESEKLPCYVLEKVVPIPQENAHEGPCPPLPVFESYDGTEEEYNEKALEEYNEKVASDYLDRPWL